MTTMSNDINAGWTVLPDGRLQIDKDPDPSLRYGRDVAGLLADGDSISSVSIAAQSGVTAIQAGHTGTVVHCRVQGGTAGTTGEVTLQWVTSQGDTDQRTMVFRLVDR